MLWAMPSLHFRVGLFEIVWSMRKPHFDDYFMAHVMGHM